MTLNILSSSCILDTRSTGDKPALPRIYKLVSYLSIGHAAIFDLGSLPFDKERGSFRCVLRDVICITGRK